MIFIDFGLLRSPYCKICLTYLLTLRCVLKFDNLHMTQCAKIIVGFMANVGNVFIKRLRTFFSFIFFPRFFTFFNVLFYFYMNVYYIYAAN